MNEIECYDTKWIQLHKKNHEGSGRKSHTCFVGQPAKLFKIRLVKWQMLANIFYMLQDKKEHRVHEDIHPPRWSVCNGNIVEMCRYNTFIQGVKGSLFILAHVSVWVYAVGAAPQAFNRLITCHTHSICAILPVLPSLWSFKLSHFLLTHWDFVGNYETDEIELPSQMSGLPSTSEVGLFRGKKVAVVVTHSLTFRPKVHYLQNVNRPKYAFAYKVACHKMNSQ